MPCFASGQTAFARASVATLTPSGRSSGRSGNSRQDSGLSARVYIAGKFCHGLLAAALTWLLARLVPMEAPVLFYLVEQSETLAHLDFSSALTASVGAALVVGLLFGLLCLGKKGGNLSRNPLYYKKSRKLE